MKTIYIVCATGIATSTMLRVKIEAFLRKHGIAARVNQYRLAELAPSRVDADVIVATTRVPEELAAVAPVIDGIPLITGQGEEETLQHLLAILTFEDS